MKPRRPTFGLSLLIAVAVLLGAFVPAHAQDKKPNIVIIWGDDIGQSNISAYSHGLMGYKTPNIDRVAREGMMFTDYYAEQSCTAGRGSFVTGQSGLRTGLTKVGLPGAAVGLQKEDPTIAELLKTQGYATGQFGKNHLGDRNEYLPRCTASTNSTATCTTSMPTKSRNCPTIRRIRISSPSSAPAA
jgi:arylsulfatase